MVTIENFKKALGDKALSMTDSEILKLKDIQEKLADIFFDIWVDKLHKNEQTNTS